MQQERAKAQKKAEEERKKAELAEEQERLLKDSKQRLMQQQAEQAQQAQARSKWIASADQRRQEERMGRSELAGGRIADYIPGSAVQQTQRQQSQQSQELQRQQQQQYQQHQHQRQQSQRDQIAHGGTSESGRGGEQLRQSLGLPTSGLEGVYAGESPPRRPRRPGQHDEVMDLCEEEPPQKTFAQLEAERDESGRERDKRAAMSRAVAAAAAEEKERWAAKARAPGKAALDLTVAGPLTISMRRVMLGTHECGACQVHFGPAGTRPAGTVSWISADGYGFGPGRDKYIQITISESVISRVEVNKAKGSMCFWGPGINVPFLNPDNDDHMEIFCATRGFNELQSSIYMEWDPMDFPSQWPDSIGRPGSRFAPACSFFNFVREHMGKRKEHSPVWPARRSSRGGGGNFVGGMKKAGAAPASAGASRGSLMVKSGQGPPPMARTAQGATARSKKRETEASQVQAYYAAERDGQPRQQRDMRSYGVGGSSSRGGASSAGGAGPSRRTWAEPMEKFHNLRGRKKAAETLFIYPNAVTPTFAPSPGSWPRPPPPLATHTPPPLPPHPPQEAKDGVTITTEELDRLSNNDFLNDSLVDYQLKVLSPGPPLDLPSTSPVISPGPSLDLPWIYQFKVALARARALLQPQPQPQPPRSWCGRSSRRGWPKRTRSC